MPRAIECCAGCGKKIPAEAQKAIEKSQVNTSWILERGWLQLFADPEIVDSQAPQFVLYCPFCLHEFYIFFIKAFNEKVFPVLLGTPAEVQVQ